jgi:hypothetical protein
MAAFASVKVSSALSTVVRSTSATVGVDKTYDPVGYIQPGVAKWEDRSSGIAVGFPSLTMSVRPPNKGSRIFKVMGKLSIPTLEAISGANVAGLTPAQQKAYECSAILELLFPERSTAAEREILRSQLASLLFTTINASDDVPTDLSASPFTTAISAYDRPY